METTILVLLIAIALLICAIAGLIIKISGLTTKIKVVENNNKNYVREFRNVVNQKDLLERKVKNLEEQVTRYNNLHQVHHVENQPLFKPARVNRWGKTTDEYKNQIVRDYKNGVTYYRMGKKYGFKPNTIYKALRRWGY